MMETVGVHSKRFRSSSVSGRLRAVSDLEDMGWIDKNQKGLIKDLIISGDTTLRSALDKYENGDVHELEGNISSFSSLYFEYILHLIIIIYIFVLVTQFW